MTTADTWEHEERPALVVEGDGAAAGWRITWHEGARTADLLDPHGSAVDCVQVVAWEWDPAEGGPSRMSGPPPTVEDLRRALREYVEGHEVEG